MKSRNGEPYILVMSGRSADRFDKRDGDGMDFAEMFHQSRALKDDYSCAGQPSTP